MTCSLDKEVKIFDMRRLKENQQAMMSINHKTGIRAIDWSCCNRHQVITGGGESDRFMRIFRTDGNKSQLVGQTQVDGQCCSILQNGGDIFLGIGSGVNQVVCYNAYKFNPSQ